MTTKVQTKFGTAVLCGDGYYRISSRKERYEGKKLSRLVFEDFYNITLPTNIHIHHNDGNKTNDNIWNLVPMTASEHCTLHNIQNGCSEATKVNISKAKTSSGFFRVFKRNTGKNNMMGFEWGYVARIDGGKIFFGAASLVDLKEKVLANGLEWFVIDEEKAKQSMELEREYYLKIMRTRSSDIFHVRKQKDKTCRQGFIWQYDYFDKNHRKRYLCSVDLEKLKKRVLDKGMEWVEYKEKLAKVDLLCLN